MFNKLLLPVVLFLAAGLLMSHQSIAAPTLSSISGETIAEGYSVTITGSGFGTKSGAKPLIWDNFERGTDGAIIAGNAPVERGIGNTWVWSDYYSGRTRPKYTTASQKTNSQKSSLHDYTSSDYNISLQAIYNMTNTGDEAYFTFYWKYDRTSSTWSRNIKPWIVYGSSSDMPLAYMGWGSPSAGDGVLRSSLQDGGGEVSSTIWSGPDISEIENEWIRVEGYVKQSGSNTSNGVYQIWIHRPFSSSPPAKNLAMSNTAVKTRSSSNYWRQWFWGFYHATDNPSTAKGYIYVDDIYFDNTRARVEICNKNTFSSSTKCDVQIPSSWSAGSVTVTINQGSFSDGDTAYMYVVDSTGAMNAQGYRITIGSGGGGGEPPSAPQGLRIQS